ncbi:MAG: hypothetical protein WC332_00280 [Clostridia bacterium]
MTDKYTCLACEYRTNLEIENEVTERFCKLIFKAFLTIAGIIIIAGLMI